ncbi:hypothetical protein JHK87_022365 [Glycine soja]|nr:hypothetical protein JHK87_022365 [Glycine soja]
MSFASSFSMLRHRAAVASTSPFLLRRFCYLPMIATRHQQQQNPNKQVVALSRKLMKEKQTLKEVLLKKIKRRVMVGDKVLVGSIDWVNRRGMIENVFHRTFNILNPPVVNVDQLVDANARRA